MRRRASQHYRAALPQRAETGPSPAIAFVISTLPDRTIPKARGCRRIPSGCTKVTTAFGGTSQERGRRPKRRSLDRNGPAQNRLLVIDVQEVVGPREFSDSLPRTRPRGADHRGDRFYSLARVRRTIAKARGCRRIPSGCTKVTTAFWGDLPR